MVVELYRVAVQAVSGIRTTVVNALGDYPSQEEAIQGAAREGKGHYYICSAIGNLFEVFMASNGEYTTTERTVLN